MDSTSETPVILKAFKFALDPTSSQLTMFAQHAGTARWAFNHAISVKMEFHQRWRDEVAALVETGLTDEVARKQVNARKDPALRVPSAFDMKAKHWISVRGDEQTGTEGISPWWRQISSYVFSSAFQDADMAWKNWMESLTGKRKGRKVGYPRRKKKHQSRDSFRIHHDVKKPTIRPDEGYRRVVIPRIGSVRTHSSTKALKRLIAKGAVVQSVTVSRGGSRWFASLLVKAPAVEIRRPATRAQRSSGAVGVDLGVKHLAALSTGAVFDNPRHLTRASARLKKAQRTLSRTQKGSGRRGKAIRRVSRLHQQVAERRVSYLHGITKILATRWASVAIEDLNVSGMTRSAAGTVEAPGSNVRQKSGLNRSILDASFGEFRRQLTYKTDWYGSVLALCARWYPSSKTCSSCGAVKTKLDLAERVYRCDQCNLVLDRDVNAAQNILAVAVPVVPEGGKTQNARGEGVNPTTSVSGNLQRNEKTSV